MRAGFLLAALLVTVAFSPLGTVQASEDAQSLRPVLAEAEGIYGSEDWKDVNATLGTVGGGTPLSEQSAEAGVYQNPYSKEDHSHQPPEGTYLGYRLEANLTLVTGDGGDPPADKDYVVDAWLQSAAGKVPARLAKLDNTTFQVVADLDGENAHAYPALTFGGQVELRVDVYEEPSDPTVERRIVASDAFRLDITRGASDADGNLFPEAQTPGYTDVGATNYTELHRGSVHPDERVSVTYRFSGASAGEDVVAHLWSGTSKELVFTGRTDDDGAVSVTFTPSKALPETDSSRLLVLEAHLEGESRVLGSKPLVLPVSPHGMQVTSIQHEKRSGPEGASTVQFTVRDGNENPSNNSRRGTLYLVKGTDVITETAFGVGDSPDPGVRTARVPADELSGYDSYGAVAMFFDDQDTFYGLASADRGASVRLEVPDAVEPNRQTQVNVSVTNENDNRDDAVDPGLSFTADIRIRDLPGAAEVVRDQVIVPEGEIRTAEIPFTPSDVGSQDFAVNVTVGEIQMDLIGSVQVQDSGFVDELLEKDDLHEAPGPAPVAAVAALAAVALSLRRRP